MYFNYRYQHIARSCRASTGQISCLVCWILNAVLKEILTLRLHAGHYRYLSYDLTWVHVLLPLLKSAALCFISATYFLIISYFRAPSLMFCRRRFSQVCTSLPVTQKMSSAVLKKCQASNFCSVLVVKTSAATVNHLRVVGPARRFLTHLEICGVFLYGDIIVLLGSWVKQVCSRLLLQVDTVSNNLRSADIDSWIRVNHVSHCSFYLQIQTYQHNHSCMYPHGADETDRIPPSAVATRRIT